MLFLNLLFESGDNPIICEICSHIGLRGNKFCPRCNVGGDKKYKMSDSGYESLFHVSRFLNRFAFSDVLTMKLLDIHTKAAQKHLPRDTFSVSQRPCRGESREGPDLDRCQGCLNGLLVAGTGTGADPASENWAGHFRREAGGLY